MTHQLGHTRHFDTVSLFKKDNLLSGIAAVHSIQILSFPDELYSLDSSQHLKNLVALYYKDGEIMRYLKTTTNIGDQVTRYQLEANQLEKQARTLTSSNTPAEIRHKKKIVYQKCLARTTTSFLIFIPS